MAIKLWEAIRRQVYCSHPSGLTKSEGGNIDEIQTVSELPG